jgi:hypothetical protein
MLRYTSTRQPKGFGTYISQCLSKIRFWICALFGFHPQHRFHVWLQASRTWRCIEELILGSQLAESCFLKDGLPTCDKFVKLPLLALSKNALMHSLHFWGFLNCKV